MNPPMVPTLIACSHGTRSERGAAAVAALVDAVQDALPTVDVVSAFVDVQEPALTSVVGSSSDRSAVVVPLLLSGGLHVHHDVANAVAANPDHVASAPLGPHGTIVDLLVERLVEAGLREHDSVVLGASASRDERAIAEMRSTARALSDRLGRVVRLGNVGHCGTPLVDVLVESRRPGRRVVVATHLLAPGHFHDAVLRAGADVVSAPLLDERRPDPRLASLVIERYAQARGLPLPTAV